MRIIKKLIMSKKSLEFHIKSGDYFGTLAIILSLIKQNPDNTKQNLKILSNIEKDLVYLQKEYMIIKK